MMSQAMNKITVRLALAAVLVPALFLAGACSKGLKARGITVSGTIEVTEVNLATKVAGEILDMSVEEGAAVKKGDVLAGIDHASLDIQLKQAQAGADLAKAQLDLLVKGARKEDISQAEEVLRQAETSLRTAETDKRRMTALEKTGSVTAKQKEDADARYDLAAAQRNSAAEALARVKRLARPEEIRAAEARLAQAEAQVDLLKKTISDCVITCPVAGTVTDRPVEPGEFVGIGTTVLTIARLDEVHVMLYVSEAELGRVKLGDKVIVSIDSVPDKRFEGRVTFISPEAEFTPKNVQTKDDRVKLVFGVKVVIPNPDGFLKPGLPADAEIVGER